MATRSVGSKPLLAPSVRTEQTAKVPSKVVDTPKAPASGFDAGSTPSTLPPALPKPAPIAQASDDALFGVASTARTSKQSLGELLDEVWSQRGQLVGRGWEPIYGMYNAVHEANPLHADPRVFAESLAGLAQHRPAGSISNLQGRGGGGDSITPQVKKAYGTFTGEAQKLDILGDFYRYERAGANFDEITERVYINAHADEAPALMKFVVQQIIDAPEKFPGVHMAKIAGPDSIDDRSDSIVIYTSGADASARVVAALEQERTRHPEELMKTVPLMTRQTGDGIATGAEPGPRFGGEMSFGSLRAEAIAAALSHLTPGASREMFDAQVKVELEQRGVDAEHPDLNRAER